VGHLKNWVGAGGMGKKIFGLKQGSNPSEHGMAGARSIKGRGRITNRKRSEINKGVLEVSVRRKGGGTGLI